jgi:protein-serine/threonine kinase
MFEKDYITENDALKQLEFSRGTPDEAQDLMTRLLKIEKDDRLTNANDIKNHPWFKSVSWEDILSKKIRNPSPLYYKNI